MARHLAFNRRVLLKGLACTAVTASRARALQTTPATDAGAVLRFLESLARPDGGYAWNALERAHLAPTFAVIGCYRLLKVAPPNRSRLIAYVKSHHPGRLKKLEQERRLYDYQQMQALRWLDEEIDSFRDRVRAWTRPLAYLKQYERHGYPIFQSECAVLLCRALLHLPASDVSPEFTRYLDERRRTNGSFNNTPAAEGGDGHVLNTLWGLQALQTLGREGELNQETCAWLRACERPGGGFTYQPEPEVAGVDDVAYTRAALRGLRLLGAPIERRDAHRAYLHSLANADGGFGDRLGWGSSAVATYCALDALEALGALDAIPPPRRRAGPVPRPLPDGLNVYSIQLEAHGTGSPAEAVDLAQCLNIHLWGAKNAAPGWIARAQAIADQRRAAVRFFRSNEEYGTWLNVPGLGTYSHISDILAPADGAIGAPLSGGEPVAWAAFRERRYAPLVKAGGRLIWQFGENEELARILLDDSFEHGGYAAISTFHFGNPDFLNSDPFLHRWQGKIPFVALQDAHGAEPWWFADMTTGFRTLFLGHEPTWDQWLRALAENWVVAVRHDAVSSLETRMHGGSGQVLDFVRRHEQDWRWWDHPRIARPLVSIVALEPDDEFEAGRPESGLALRVRCAWENTTQGLPRQPLTELHALTLDGEKLDPELITVPNRQGRGVADQYHLASVPKLAPGDHSAAATLRVLATRAEATRTIVFHTD